MQHSIFVGFEHMGVAEWTSLAGLGIGIIVPLGTLIWVIGERGRTDRVAINQKVDALHIALDNFRVENANDMGEIRGRIQVIEARSFRIRHGDPDTREL